MRHACPDWDYMVIGPGDIQMEGCLCEGQDRGSEVCQCGDYRRQHKNGVGVCDFNGRGPDACHGNYDCAEFRTPKKT